MIFSRKVHYFNYKMDTMDVECPFSYKNNVYFNEKHISIGFLR